MKMYRIQISIVLNLTQSFLSKKLVRKINIKCLHHKIKEDL